MNDETAAKPRRLLRREERRAQLIRAAATAFGRRGFAATSLEDVAAEAGVTKVVIYRHFDTKRDLYLAVLFDVRAQLKERLRDVDDGLDSMRRLAIGASENPDGYRLLFRHARHEPEFTDIVAELRVADHEMAEMRLRKSILDRGRRAWLAGLMPALVIEAVLAWLDAGQPVSPDEVARTVHGAARYLIAATEQARG